MELRSDNHAAGALAQAGFTDAAKASNDSGPLMRQDDSMAWMSSIADGRVLGFYSSGLPGPLILAVGGMHGNEPYGPRAIKAFLDMLYTRKPVIKGAFLALTGNMTACSQGRRYLCKDLDSCFLPDLLREDARQIIGTEFDEVSELNLILTHLRYAYDDVCFIDCHTAAALTIPYLSINKHAASVRLADKFPLKNVIGLQHDKPGNFTDYCNKLNFRGFSFEAGQHLSAAAFSNQVVMLWLMLVHCGALQIDELENFQQYRDMLEADSPSGKQTYGVLARYVATDAEEFRIQPGLENFDFVEKNRVIAVNRHGEIRAPADGYLLMPLQYERAADGFALIRETAAFS